MKFSIIVPVYNVAPYLRECLDSVLAQTVNDPASPNCAAASWEAICIDDGSTDGSGAILDEYAARDSRFRVIHKENGGVSSARNAALDVACGEYIVFVDSDDSISRNALKYLNDVIMASGADLVKFANGNEESLDNVQTRVYYLSNVGDIRAAYNCFCGNLIAWNGCYKRSKVGKLRFVEGMPNGEDILFGSEFFCRCEKVFQTNATIYRYRYREGSAVNTITSRHLISICLMVKKKCTGDVWRWVASHGLQDRFLSKIRTHLIGEVMMRIGKIRRKDRIEVWQEFFDASKLVLCSKLFRIIGFMKSKIVAVILLGIEFKLRKMLAGIR